MLDEKKLKRLVKSAFIEAVEKQRLLVQDIVEEAIVDVALTRAVDEGLRSRNISRATVFKIIDRE